MKQTTRFDRAKFEVALGVVTGWDFGLTVQKLQEPGYAGWSRVRAERAERDYKRYLAVTSALDGYQLVPNGDIDRFWHEHILDTRRYAADCETLFSSFLHHYPFFGMRGETDEAAWRETAELSDSLWSDLFGESLYGQPVTQSMEEQVSSDSQATTLNINININVVDGKPKVAVNADGAEAEWDSESIAQELQMSAAQKCPQKCPSEG